MVFVRQLGRELDLHLLVKLRCPARMKREEQLFMSAEREAAYVWMHTQCKKTGQTCYGRVQGTSSP